jgi:hypothetical protein
MCASVTDMTHTPTVERYTLHVDARDTLDAVLNSTRWPFDTERGESWSLAIDAITQYRLVTYIVPIGMDVDHEDFSPYARSGSVDSVECGYCHGVLCETEIGYVHAANGDRVTDITPGDFVSAAHNRAGTRVDHYDVVTRNRSEIREFDGIRNESHAVLELHALGFVANNEIQSAWADSHGGDATYADDARFIDYVTVVKGFRVITVAYAPESKIYGTAWAIHDDVTVPVGTYVSFRYGIYGTRLHTTAFLPNESDVPSVEGLVEVEGFDCSRMDAGCNTCGGEWEASDGSWTFHDASHEWGGEPRSTVMTWSYDDASDHDDAGTIACVVSDCAGRIGFNVS